MAATFDTALARQIGQAIYKEARAKNVDAVLAPTVNLHRSPLGGRNFECYSEDPVLSGLIAAAWINGVQENGDIIVVPKHFVCNEMETDRKTSNSIVDDRTLRELYLMPFQILLRKADIKALMTAYNKLNGIYCSENERLLQDILRKEWNYDGLLMSDWHGTYSTVAAARVGIDLEMPGPTLERGAKLISAVQEGTVTESEINNRARRVVQISNHSMSDLAAVEKANHDRDTSSLIRKAGAEGMVLLKNENALLPLKPSQRIAVIGAPAFKAMIKGGGSSTVAEEEYINPIEVFQAEFPNLISYTGVPVFKKLSSPNAEILGSSLVTLEWYNGHGYSDNQIIKAEVIDQLSVHVFDNPLPALLPEHCVRISCKITPKTTGNHLFGVTASGLTKLYVNDTLLLVFPGFKELNPDYILRPGDYELRAAVQMDAGRTYDIRIDALSTVAPSPPGFRICPQATQVGFMEEIKNDFTDLANADAAVVFVGNTADYESESFDRDTISLSPGQDDLIREVSSIIGCNKTVVVNLSGAPVGMPWIENVSSCIQAWYAGQQVGNSILDVLVGRINPCGRLPVCFPRNLEDTASWGNFPSSKTTKDVIYEEGVFMGYRHHLRNDKPDPLFWFGHGLSYSEFRYSNMSIDAGSVDCRVTVTITNLGPYSGKEVIQLYIRDVESSVEKPVRELKNVAKVFLEVGESADLVIELDAADLSFWNTDKERWVVEKGEFSIELCRSAAEVVAKESLWIEEAYEWSGLAPSGG